MGFPHTTRREGRTTPCAPSRYHIWCGWLVGGRLGWEALSSVWALASLKSLCFHASARFRQQLKLNERRCCSPHALHPAVPRQRAGRGGARGAPVGVVALTQTVDVCSGAARTPPRARRCWRRLRRRWPAARRGRRLRRCSRRQRRSSVSRRTRARRAPCVATRRAGTGRLLRGRRRARRRHLARAAQQPALPRRGPRSASRSGARCWPTPAGGGLTALATTTNRIPAVGFSTGRRWAGWQNA